MTDRFETADGRLVPAVTAEEMREVDRVAVEETGPELLSMMENAGRTLAAHAIDLVGDVGAGDGDGRGRDGPDDGRGDDTATPPTVAVLAGGGGNGGGGLCAARHLHDHGHEVRVLLDRPPGDLSGAPAAQYRTLDATPVPVHAPGEWRPAGGEGGDATDGGETTGGEGVDGVDTTGGNGGDGVDTIGGDAVDGGDGADGRDAGDGGDPGDAGPTNDDDRPAAPLRAVGLDPARTVAVDAVVGYGLTDALRGPAADLARACGPATRVVSLDVPTGVVATTGDRPGVAVAPDRTLTLALPKTGLTRVGGELHLADIGIPPATFGRAGVEYPRPGPFDAGGGGEWSVRLRRD